MQLIVAGTVLLASTICFIVNDIQLFRRDLVNNLDSMARVLGLNLAPTIAFMDSAEAEKILSSLKETPNVISAQLFDKNGVLFAKYGDPALTVNQLSASVGRRRAAFEPGRLRVYHTLYTDNEIMGVLLLISDTQVIKAQAINYMLIALAVLATGLAITYLLAQYTQRQFSGPIEWLVNITKKISGSGDYSLRAGENMPASTPMEIATLSEEFDH